jgi:serine/threonine protein kinase
MTALNPRLTDSSAQAHQSEESPEQIPEQFGRYRIIKRLGQGGMGSVYLAQDTHLERPVALKIPDFEIHEGVDARRRFLEEARAAATLDHPYLCRVYETGEIEGRPFLTMAYIEGQSLAALIDDEGWPQRQVAALVGKLALAFQEAHTRKVIHRDLKPANVMIKTTGGRREPVIVDFGLARRDNPQEQRLTRSGQIMGTLGYMAPEQIRGDLKEIGLACDIYALGVILYELLTGRLPFTGSGLAVAGKILTQTPLPPSTYRSDLDPALEAICLKAMAKDVGNRYASMAELAAALTGFIHSLSATPTATETVGSDGSPSPNSDERLKPARSDSLIRQFLGHLVENDPSPSPIPTPEPVAPGAPLPERRRPPRPLIVAAAALGILIVSALIYVIANTDLNKKIDAGAGIRTNEPVLFPKSTFTAVRSSAEPLFNGSDLKGWEFDLITVMLTRGGLKIKLSSPSLAHRAVVQRVHIPV